MGIKLFLLLSIALVSLGAKAQYKLHVHNNDKHELILKLQDHNIEQLIPPHGDTVFTVDSLYDSLNYSIESVRCVEGVGAQPDKRLLPPGEYMFPIAWNKKNKEYTAGVWLFEPTLYKNKR